MSKPEHQFTDREVDFVNSFLQGHMARHQIDELTADECADLLDESGVLPAIGHPKKGYRFREMLRQGRDGKIPKVQGSWQERPNTPWHVYSDLRSSST